MIRNYLNQTVIWGRAGQPNEYNEVTWANTNIKGRKQSGFKLIRDAQGAEVVSSTMIITETVVSIGDLLDGDEVIVLNPAIDLNGKRLWDEVYLK